MGFAYCDHRHHTWGDALSLEGSKSSSGYLDNVSTHHGNFYSECGLVSVYISFIHSPNHSLTLWDAVSSHRTLQYMFWVTIIFLPIVLGYTFWVFRILRGKMQTAEVLAKAESY
jgi:hypothetical protein